MNPPEGYTKQDALRLARTIERFWRNGSVRVWAEPLDLGGIECWIVQSNLVNGIPPARVRAVA